MTDKRPAPIFVADFTGLDFLNTLATPVDTQVEWIGSGEDLISWLLRAGLVSPEAIAKLRKTAAPGEFDAAAAQARKLREWFRGFVKAHKGRPLNARALQELEPLNRVLMRDEEFGQIVAQAPARRNKDAGQNESRLSGGLERSELQAIDSSDTRTEAKIAAATAAMVLSPKYWRRPDD
jgi:Putative stress-induced transcription regulator